MFRLRLVEQPMPTGSKDTQVLLEWLIDSGGSVSDVAQALDLRVPHASLALSQLRESGDVIRDDDTGIRGAIHQISDKGRARLELDAVACLEKYVREIPENMDAVVLDSNGPMLLLGYANKTPPSLIQLPIDPHDLDGDGNLDIINGQSIGTPKTPNLCCNLNFFEPEHAFVLWGDGSGKFEYGKRTELEILNEQLQQLIPHFQKTWDDILDFSKANMTLFSGEYRPDNHISYRGTTVVFTIYLFWM